jgi:hypothetical protein
MFSALNLLEIFKWESNRRLQRGIDDRLVREPTVCVCYTPESSRAGRSSSRQLRAISDISHCGQSVIAIVRVERIVAVGDASNLAEAGERLSVAIYHDKTSVVFLG